MVAHAVLRLPAAAVLPARQLQQDEEGRGGQTDHRRGSEPLAAHLHGAARLAFAALIHRAAPTLTTRCIAGLYPTETTKSACTSQTSRTSWVVGLHMEWCGTVSRRQRWVQCTLFDQPACHRQVAVATCPVQSIPASAEHSGHEARCMQLCGSVRVGKVQRPGPRAPTALGAHGPAQGRGGGARRRLPLPARPPARYRPHRPSDAAAALTAPLCCRRRRWWT
jgi:hypothetical protein